MAHIALYREWRPTSFEKVVEQEHITKTLKRAVVTGRISHAYLFSGTRGTGKTSLAKIFARAVNCLDPKDGEPCNKCEICKKALDETLMDIAEIDAASNNSVDNIRRICDEVNYMPSLARFKVYIIDEVHMLSTSAFNALLKTLEEPPSYAIFILCTTEPNKLPATVLSRCQRFDFHRITVKGIEQRLKLIAKAENENITDDATEMIARISFGAMRDAISLLDQCISSTDKTIEVEDVLNCAGLIDEKSNAKVSKALAENDVKGILSSVNDVIAEGKSPSRFLSGLLGYLRNILVCMNINDPSDFIEADSNAIEQMKTLSKMFDADTVIRYIKELSENEAVLRRASQPKTYLEIMLIGLLVKDDVKGVERKPEKKKDAANELTDIKEEKLYKAEKKASDISIESSVKQPEKQSQSKAWSKFIQDRISEGSKDVFELKNSSIEIVGNQAKITVQSTFLKDSLEYNKDEVLKEIQGYNSEIKNVKFVCSANNVQVNTIEGDLLKIGKEHNIEVEIE